MTQKAVDFDSLLRPHGMLTYNKEMKEHAFVLDAFEIEEQKIGPLRIRLVMKEDGPGIARFQIEGPTYYTERFSHNGFFHPMVGKNGTYAEVALPAWLVRTSWESKDPKEILFGYAKFLKYEYDASGAYCTIENWTGVQTYQATNKGEEKHMARNKKKKAPPRAGEIAKGGGRHATIGVNANGPGGMKTKAKPKGKTPAMTQPKPTTTTTTSSSSTASKATIRYTSKIENGQRVCTQYFADGTQKVERYPLATNATAAADKKDDKTNEKKDAKKDDKKSTSSSSKSSTSTSSSSGKTWSSVSSNSGSSGKTTSSSSSGSSSSYSSYSSDPVDVTRRLITHSRITSKAPARPKVYIDPKAYHKMSLWAALSGQKSREMICFAHAKLRENGSIEILDTYMVKHKGSQGGVDADDEAVIQLMMKKLQEGIPPDESMMCWIHSHPGSGPGATYLSGTDEANIERFMTGNWLVSIVFDSKGGNPYCRIDTRFPRMKIESDLVVEYLTQEEIDQCKKDYEELSSAWHSSSSRSWTPSKSRSGGGHYPSYGGRGGYSQMQLVGDDEDDMYEFYGGWHAYGGNRSTTAIDLDRDVPDDPVDSVVAGEGIEMTEAQMHLLDAVEEALIAENLEDAAKKIQKLPDEAIKLLLAYTFELEEEDVQNEWLGWVRKENGWVELLAEIANVRAEDAGVSLDPLETEGAASAITLEQIADELPESGSDVKVEVLKDDTAQVVLDLPARMNKKAIEDDLDQLGQDVLAKKMTKETAITVAKDRHKLTEKQAREMLETRIG
jgi:proteasome lid subunit RPN8/RPN11